MKSCTEKANMLRGLLRGGATKALLENLGLFNDPERLEKYVVASEVTVEVLDLFFARILGTEKAPIENVDVSAVRDHLSGLFLNDSKGPSHEALREGVGDHDSVMERMADLERQLAAMQRQLKMQGEVSELAVAVNERLDKIVSKSEKQMTETGQEICDVKSQVAQQVELLKKEINSRASAVDVEALSKELSSLREAERRLDGRIVSVEAKIKEANQALREEIQGKIKKMSEQITITPANGPLNGIIAYLTQQCGGNVHEKGCIEVTGSSALNSSGVPKNVVDPGKRSYFYSEDKPDQWICFDFKDKRVTATSYSITTVNSACNPKSWVLEVSNDGRDGSWLIVDRRSDNYDLKARWVTHNFPVSQTYGSFRFVRLRQTGKDHDGLDHLVLGALEVFGTLSSS